ncbi:hypothetical protein [Apilactobacillus timberlakei]|uniref:hypothetical protein n=1 Tax=Apilactobacillus timberlakei TaxID=2008380 RepID=UPI00112685DE|nr:hypothetical protein [Apilactobacillus timberlakei]TPR16737.1 hypothetical protein DYZ95_07085 [Apilactobacillus timberlakei]TPR21500.1 hypothetical protein DY083_05635 [Apilactobacillus timberlakei]
MGLFKREYGANELQAMSQAYDSKNISKASLVTPLVFVGMNFMFSYYLFISIFWGIFWTLLAVIYAYISIMPREVSTKYYREGYSQRYQAINIMTLSLSDDSNKAEDVIKIAAERVSGEFQNDLYKLLSSLEMKLSREKVRQAFTEIQEKYYEDYTFVRYMKQLETFFYEGTANVAAFERLLKTNNGTYKKTISFIKNKKAINASLLGLMLLIFFVVKVVGVSVGSWYDFAHSFVGIITLNIDFIVAFIAFNVYAKKYYDDSVTTRYK